MPSPFTPFIHDAGPSALRRVHVRAFKSLENVGIELGRVNVFIGANGSGKSNLLEAIGVLGAAASGRVDDETLLRRGVRPGVPALYKSSFKGSKFEKSIRIEAESARGMYTVNLYNPIKDPKPAWRYETEALYRDGERVFGRSNRSSPESLQNLASDAGLAALKAVEMPDGDPAGELLRSLRSYAIFSPDTGTLRGLRPDPQSREPVGLNGGQLAEALSAVRSLLSGLDRWNDILESAVGLIDWAYGFGAGTPGEVPISRSAPQLTRLVRFRDRFMKESRNTLSGYDASEGALYVLFMLVVACHPGAPSVLAVDNFDHALNPRLARALTSAVCEWSATLGGRQLLLTSHNPLVLDGLPLRDDDDVRLFTVERSSKGKTVINRVHVTEQILAQAHDGMPLSQQWIVGTFGGVPNI